MNGIFQTIKNNPAIVAIFAVVMILIATRKSGAGDNGIGATLSSQQIATGAAVDLAAIQAQREGIVSAERIAAMNVKGNIIKGWQDLAIAEKQIGVELAGEVMRSATAMRTDNSVFLSDMMNNVAGYKIAEKNALLDARRIEIDKDISLASLSTQKALGSIPFDIAKLNSQLSDLINSREVALADAINSREIGFDYFSLPMEIDLARQTMIEREATTRNLAWRAKQIASKQMLGNLLNTLTGGFMNLGSQLIGSRTIQ